MAVTVSSRSFITYLPDSLYVCLPAISLDDYLSMFQRSSAPTFRCFPGLTWKKNRTFYFDQLSLPALPTTWILTFELLTCILLPPSSINLLLRNVLVYPEYLLLEDQTDIRNGSPSPQSGRRLWWVSVLRSFLTLITTLPSASSSPMAIPSACSGEAVECSGFLHPGLTVYWDAAPEIHHRKGFLLSLLSSRALLWACAIWKSQSIIINSFDAFVFFFWNFWEIYGLAVHTWSAPTPRKINCEWLHFVVLHPGSYEWLEWVSPSYCLPSGARFTDLHSNGHLRWQSVIGKFHVASRVDFSVHHRMPFWWYCSSTSLSPCRYPIPEPIQMDATRLTRIKWAQRLSSSLCLYCGSSGHFIWTCPTHPPHPVVNTPPALRVLLLEPYPSGAELWHREQGIAGH